MQAFCKSFSIALGALCLSSVSHVSSAQVKTFGGQAEGAAGPKLNVALSRNCLSRRTDRSNRLNRYGAKFAEASALLDKDYSEDLMWDCKVTRSTREKCLSYDAKSKLGYVIINGRLGQFLGDGRKVFARLCSLERRSRTRQRALSMARPEFLASLIKASSPNAKEDQATNTTLPEPQEQPVQGMKIADYTSLMATKLSDSPLRPASEAELEQHIKNGLRMGVRVHGDMTSIGPTPLGGLPPISVRGGTDPIRTQEESQSQSDMGGATTNTTDGKQTSAADDFSVTNTHEKGVDESDFVKYDGEHLFISTFERDANKQTKAAIRILEAYAFDASAAEVGSIPLDTHGWGQAKELYLFDDGTQTRDVISIRPSMAYPVVRVIPPVPLVPVSRPAPTDISVTDAENNPTIAFSTAPRIAPTKPHVPTKPRPAPRESQIQIEAFNVTDISAPTSTFKVAIDGKLVTSRKVDNMLYLVTRYSPYVPQIKYYFRTEEEAQKNEVLIGALTLEDLLPSVSINGAQATPLVKASDCLVPENLDPKAGYRHLVALVAINLDTQQLSSARCLSTNVAGVYSSPNSLYLGDSSQKRWAADSKTVFHKFTLGEQLNYRATASVPGTINWRTPASLRMNEYNSYFRVVTTMRDQNRQLKHMLTVLSESDEQKLVPIAQIPNQTRPEPIGKPREDIYAVRFMENRAFIVTFRRIDPLYVIDLSNAQDPFIAGELEVPGFSTYLHPIDDDLLLGVGSEGNQSNVKVSLYDISDQSAPTEISNQSLQLHTSTALHDLRALTFLRTSENQLRFTIPTTQFKGSTEVVSNGRVYYTSRRVDNLQLFEVNGLSSQSASLDLVGSLEADDPNATQNKYRRYDNRSRGILHDDAIFFVNSSQVWSSFWSSPKSVNGPF